MSEAIIQASNIEIPIADIYQTNFGFIEDLSTLWRIDEILKKHIRKLEKTCSSKKRRVRDPNAPKKEASQQLLSWNEQVRRIVSLSEKSVGGKIAYNHALKIGGILKKDGKLSVSKEGDTIPDDETIISAVNSYHETVNPQLKVKESPSSPKENNDSAISKKQTITMDNVTTGVEEDIDINTYTFIISGKSYERGDINGKAYIWDQKGKYMGVYDEKAKKFDATFPDPTA